MPDCIIDETFSKDHFFFWFWSAYGHRTKDDKDVITVIF